MEIIGIIAEYNPFHLGHKYQIDLVKKIYPDSIIVVCLSSSFTQRGIPSVMNKWDKTKIALLNGVDLVVELPFVYSSQSADIFAHGAVKILNELGVSKIVFGSESNDIKLLKDIANLQINNIEFDEKVKYYLDKGCNYPTALSSAISKFGLEKVDSPNDLLGISYIKEIIKNNYDIEPLTIKRTNNYHGNNSGNILSASEIRNRLNKNISINNFINYEENILYKNIDIFPLLKYKIISDNNLEEYQTVDEGIEGRINKYINNSYSLEDFINKIKTKRYTYNKINRMFIHILTSFKKEDNFLDLDYIRILGFNKSKGRVYLNKIKKCSNVKFVTCYKPNISKTFDLEFKATKIYSLITGDATLIKRELGKPIYIDD